MKPFILLCLLFFLPVAEAEIIYKWTDSQGVLHLSDKPHPGAEEINVPQAQTYPAPQDGPTNASSLPSAATESETDTSPDYVITIVEPADQATLRNVNGDVRVVISIDPELQKSDRVQIIFDGSPVGKPENSTVFDLRQINRGTHSLAAQILNSEGEVVSKSDNITIFMKQPWQGMGAPSRAN